MMKPGWVRSVLTGGAALLALGLAASACDDSATEPGSMTDGSGPPPPSASSALVSLWLTDAPGDIAEAWVQIDAIYLQGREDLDDEDGNDSDGNGNGNGNGDMDGSGRFFLLEDPTGWINLMELADETLVLVEDVVVEEGLYSQLRFVLGEALLVTEGGNVFATTGADLEALNEVREELDPELEPIEAADGLLHCPSCPQSGLKVKFPGDGPLEITEGGGEIIVLDFDVSQSFGHEAGRSGRWIMHPVILGDEFEAGAVGSVAGTVALDTDVELPACGGGDLDLSIFVPIAVMGDVQKTTAVAEDGSFSFEMLAVGDWMMDFESSIDFENGDELVLEATADPATVTVEADATSNVDYTITSATCNTGS